MIDCTSVEDLLAQIKNEEHSIQLFDRDIKLNPQILDETFEAIRSSTSLYHLNLYKNSMDSSTLTKLFAAIEMSKSLTSVFICKNNIDNEKAIELFKILENHLSLRSLSLVENNIGDYGAIALANAISKRRIQLINLHGNPITEIGAAALDKTVLANPNILNIIYPSRSEAVVEKLKGRKERVAEHKAALLELCQIKPINDFAIHDIIAFNIHYHPISWLNEKLYREDNKKIDLEVFGCAIKPAALNIYVIYPVISVALKEQLPKELAHYIMNFWIQVPYNFKPYISNMPSLQREQTHQEGAALSK